MKSNKIIPTIAISICTLMLIGCGEETVVKEGNLSIKSSPSKAIEKNVEIENQKKVEDTIEKSPSEKNIPEEDISEEEVFDGEIQPKSDEELADEQSKVVQEIEKEIYDGVLPVKSEKERLSETNGAKLNITDKKSDVELADEAAKDNLVFEE